MHGASKRLNKLTSLTVSEKKGEHYVVVGHCSNTEEGRTHDMHLSVGVNNQLHLSRVLSSKFSGHSKWCGCLQDDLIFIIVCVTEAVQRMIQLCMVYTWSQLCSYLGYYIMSQHSWPVKSIVLCVRLLQPSGYAVWHYQEPFSDGMWCQNPHMTGLMKLPPVQDYVSVTSFHPQHIEMQTSLLNTHNKHSNRITPCMI